MKIKKRSYRMTARAEQAAQTERKIIEAMVFLWKELPLTEITLEKVAERAGVTTRTVLRKYGSKEGLMEVCITTDAGSYEKKRSEAPAGDIEACLQVLLAEYEDMGDAVVRTLAVEDQFPIAHKLLAAGRAVHRQWCARVFAPYLPDPADPAYEARLLTFIAATELYLWKLLRRDLGQSYDQTLHVFRSLVEGLIDRSTNEQPIP